MEVKRGEESKRALEGNAEPPSNF